MEGRIHSIESMGLVDGPGIRTVVFLQGCDLRCRFCHNPDTWAGQTERTKTMPPRELLRRLCRFKPYYGASGGVTFSGGEPLLQQEFLAEMLPLCREAGIHVCLDTAGCGPDGCEALLPLTDLVLLDVKDCEPEGFHRLTGGDFSRFRRFLDAAQRLGTPLWLRHVVVPGLNDSPEHLEAMLRFCSGIRHVERVELLPYHTLGVHKYHSCGIPYSLEGVEPMDPEVLRPWQERFDRSVTASHHL